jgi:hypothetical protein
VEARTVTKKTAAEIAEWCGGVLVETRSATDPEDKQPGINLQCGDEIKRASVGDVVLLKADGTFEVR